MLFTSKEKSTLILDLFDNKLVYAHNEEPFTDVTLPIEVELISEATLYSNLNQHLLDYSPQTLGYYWINNNKCLRTRKGLAFKTAENEQNYVQAQLKEDGTFIHQEVDWQKSTKPKNEKEYTFKKVTQLKVMLHKAGDNEWYLMKGDQKLIILKPELAFSYTFNSETGFGLTNNVISYYDRPLLNVDIDSFSVLNCNYAIDKNRAFCGDSAILGVDVASFSALTHAVAKDKNHVYYFGRVLKHADAASVQLFDYPESLFFKDKNHVFEGENILIEADVDTFKEVGEIFGIDKNHVYRFSKQLKYVDVNTFEIINENYFKDKNAIYSNIFEPIKICENHDSFQELDSAHYQFKQAIYYLEGTNQGKKISDDIAHFKRLQYGWAKDTTTLFLEGEVIFKGEITTLNILDENYVIVNKKVFWRHQEIKSADVDTFITDVLDFALDKNFIYHAGEQLKGSHPSSFKQLDAFSFKDKNSIYLIDEYDGYFLLSHIKNIDTTSIEILEGGYFKNKQMVYFNEEKLLGADPTSFKIVQSGAYSYDKHAVYYLGKKLPKLNPKKIELINYQFICDDKTVFYNDTELNLNAHNIALLTDDFIKDKSFVYYKNTLINEADANSFEIINRWFQKDKNRLFHQTTPLELNVNTFKIENETYAYDEQKAYFTNEQIKGVDMASFEVLSDNFSRDKFHVYHMHKKLKIVDAPSFEVMSYSVFKDKNHFYTFKNGKFVVEGKADCAEAKSTK